MDNLGAQFAVDIVVDEKGKHWLIVVVAVGKFDSVDPTRMRIIVRKIRFKNDQTFFF